MNENFSNELLAWLTQAGLAGTSETDIVSVFCDRCVTAGIPLGRAHVAIDTLHPVHEGRLFRWGYTNEPLVHEYGRTSLAGRRIRRCIVGCTGDGCLAAWPFLQHATDRRVAPTPPSECRQQRRVLNA